MTRIRVPKADPAQALALLRSGDSAFPGYAVCKRTTAKHDAGSVLQVVMQGLTYRQAVDAADPLPSDHLVCLMPGAR